MKIITHFVTGLPFVGLSLFALLAGCTETTTNVRQDGDKAVQSPKPEPMLVQPIATIPTTCNETPICYWVMNEGWVEADCKAKKDRCEAFVETICQMTALVKANTCSNN